MTHDTIVALAALGVVGQVLAGALILVGGAAAAGLRAPLRWLRDALWGSAPGGCATKWIKEFRYITIPTLALTGFVLLVGFLLLSAAGADEEASISTFPAHA